MRKRMQRGTRKTTCSGCGIEVEETRKGQRYCKKCHAANMRKNRPPYSMLKPEEKLKANCRSYANIYLNRGHLKKQPCEVCNNIDSQMHHNDYNKPLQVIWLCRKHHLQKHIPAQNKLAPVETRAV